MSEFIERIELDPIEKSRTYNFPNGQQITYDNVVAVYKTNGSTGRIETYNNGEKRIHIINNNWLTIDIDSKDFTL